MKQHLIKGRGQPTVIPTAYSQLYLDLDTNEHWLSFGIDTVDDWSGPFVTREALDTALADYASGLGDGSTKGITRLDVEMHEFKGRSATAVPTNRNSQLYVISDPDAVATEFDLWVEPETALDEGTQLVVFNDSTAGFVLRHDSDVFRYAGGLTPGQVFPSKAMIGLKLLGATLNTRYWLVWIISAGVSTGTVGGGGEPGAVATVWPHFYTYGNPGMNGWLTIPQELYDKPLVLLVDNTDLSPGGWYTVTFATFKDAQGENSLIPEGYEIRIINKSPKHMNLLCADGYGWIEYIVPDVGAFLRPFGSATLKAVNDMNGEIGWLMWGDLDSSVVGPI